MNLNKVNKILFVCMGNICRSPSAEGVFRHLVSVNQLDTQFEIDSAGTHAYHIGKPPDRRSQKIAKNRGIDLSTQSARQVQNSDFEYYDYIVAMDEHNLAHLQHICPKKQQHKLSRLLSFLPNSPLRSVPDPYYEDDFDGAFDLIESASKKIISTPLKVKTTVNMAHQNKYYFDVVIIGSGTAGLMCALELDKKLNIAILSKKLNAQGSSTYAQGGIAAVLDAQDSIEKHTQDTLKTAMGLANKRAVKTMISDSQSAIVSLEQYGVVFSQTGADYHLTKEGGHQIRRIAHIADKTGSVIQASLLDSAKHSQNISFFEHYLALDLLTNNKQCHGVRVLENNTEQVSQFLGQQTILATGGASKVYIYTSNPDTSTGDGIAMAYRAGCELIDMEFNQFHPTCLYHKQAKSFLVSEALRGEGAKLVLPNGDNFMVNYDWREELAPRDIVAYAIDSEMKRLGIDCVYLDISFKDNAWIKHCFPTVYQKCLSFGIDITKERIPVVPAAHYTCGGVKTDLNASTDIKGLFAIGEVASTGVHGANRLASNSLLECVVFAKRCADFINTRLENIQFPTFSLWDDSTITSATEQIMVKHLWDEVRTIMWNFVGIVRNNERLFYAKKHIRILKQEVEVYYRRYKISADLIELRNLTQVAELIIKASLMRKESRGLYYNTDYPETLPVTRHSRIKKRKKKTEK